MWRLKACSIGGAGGGRLRVRWLDSAIARCARCIAALNESSSLPVHASIPPVLDGVVAAVAQSPGDLRPALSHFVDHPFDHHALLGGDGLVVQGRLQVLVESLPALLGRSVAHVLRDAYPVVGSLFAHELEQRLVLFWNPRPTTVCGRHYCSELKSNARLFLTNL